MTVQSKSGYVTVSEALEKNNIKNENDLQKWDWNVIFRKGFNNVNKVFGNLLAIIPNNSLCLRDNSVNLHECSSIWVGIPLDHLVKTPVFLFDKDRYVNCCHSVEVCWYVKGKSFIMFHGRTCPWHPENSVMTIYCT